ncbi:SIMPL domain-containing protein [Patescibacteria group bacterium]|nr:SIMPL domain-containing protein [Patescibacteria group bacterium]
MPIKLLSITCAILSIVTTIYVGTLIRNSTKTYNYIGISEEKQHSIVMSGEGEIDGTPDVANIQLGLNTEKIKIEDAQTENTRTINKVINQLKEDLKIDKKDIKTTNYNINPRYDWIEGRRILKGYIVSQNIDIKIRNLEVISEVLKLAGDNNLDQVSGLSFSIDEPEKLKQEARMKALENANIKAEALAKSLNIKLGKVINFSESSGSIDYPIMIRAVSMKDEAVGYGGSAPSPSIEAGSTKIKMFVTVEYEIY